MGVRAMGGSLGRLWWHEKEKQSIRGILVTFADDIEVAGGEDERAVLLLLQIARKMTPLSGTELEVDKLEISTDDGVLDLTEHLSLMEEGMPVTQKVGTTAAQIGLITGYNWTDAQMWEIPKRRLIDAIAGGRRVCRSRL